MPFCPICKSNHDPDYLCVDRARESLEEAGIMITHKDTMSREEFRRETREIEKKMITKILLIVVITLLALGITIFIAEYL